MQQIYSSSCNSSNVTYPTALDPSGNLVSAVTAPRRGQYRCLECSSEMVVCRGDVKQPYFRHSSDPSIERFCNPESFIHKLAKRLLKEKLDLALRENTPFILKWECTDCHKDFSINLTDCIDQVEVEQSLFNNAVRPDVTSFNKGIPVITLEIVNTHSPEEKTLKICEDNGVRVFVIPVSPQKNLVEEWQHNEVKGKWVLSENSLAFTSSLCEQCTKHRMETKALLIERQKRDRKEWEKRKEKQKREQEKKEKKLEISARLNHDRLRRWDGKELIILSDKVTRKPLGLFRGYKKDSKDNQEYVFYCDLSKISKTTGLSWVKGDITTKDIEKEIGIEERLLSISDIYKSRAKATYHPMVLIERMDSADWVKEIVKSRREEWQIETKRREEEREREVYATFAIEDYMKTYNATLRLPQVKISEEFNIKCLVESQDKNIRDVLTEEEEKTELLIKGIWDCFFKYHYEAGPFNPHSYNPIFNQLPFIPLKGTNNVLYAVIGISNNFFPFCNSRIIYAIPYKNIKEFSVYYLTRFNTDDCFNLVSSLPSVLKSRMYDKGLFLPHAIKINIDELILTERGEGKGLCDIQNKGVTKSIIPLTARDLAPIPLCDKLSLNNLYLSNSLNIKACVSYEQKQLAKDFKFSWNVSRKIWERYCDLKTFIKYLEFLPFKTEIIQVQSEERDTNFAQEIEDALFTL